MEYFRTGVRLPPPPPAFASKRSEDANYARRSYNAKAGFFWGAPCRLTLSFVFGLLDAVFVNFRGGCFLAASKVTFVFFHDRKKSFDGKNERME